MDALVLDGRYRIGERLGEGGMGAVWEAVDERLERQVAVKVMSGVSVRRDPRAKERFDREAKLLAGLASPYVVTVHDAGEAVVENNRLLYLVMERLHGQSLSEVVDEALPPLDEVARWAEQICRALSVAHDAGVVHRDLKPANVMVCADGLVRVLDFGIAAVLTENPDMARLTSTGLVVGTPAYMAPEQIETGSYDSRSDLYALGCMLYELVVGRPPFEGEALYALMRQHMTRVPDLPSVRRPGVPGEWDALIMHLLAKDPAARPSHASEVARGLRQLPCPQVDPTPDFTPRAAEADQPPPGYEPTRIDPRMAMAAPPRPDAGLGAGSPPGGFGPPVAAAGGALPTVPGVPPMPPAAAMIPPQPATPPDGVAGGTADGTADDAVPQEDEPVWLDSGASSGPYPLVEQLTVTLGWTVRPDVPSEPEVDGSALVVDEDGQVLSDGHFVFYNNLTLASADDDTRRALVLEEYEPPAEDESDGTQPADPLEHRFSVVADWLAPEAAGIAFGVSLHEAEERGHDMSLLAEVTVRVADGATGTELCRFRIPGEELGDNRGATLGELFRTDQGWGFKATTRHFPEGLVEIAQSYGVNV